MTITDALLREVLPGWMLRTERAHWKALMRATLTVADRAVDHVRIARLASMPGQVVGPDYGGFESLEALGLIGRDRRLRQGKHEPVVEYAARARYWRDAWRAAGTPLGFLSALRAVLRPAPYRVRLVRGGVQTSEGYWWTLDDTGLRYQATDAEGSHNGLFWPADGGPAEADATAAAAWDWDSADWLFPTNPDPSRTWAIVYATSGAADVEAYEGPYDDGLSVFGEKEAVTGDPYTIGTRATHSYVEIARAVAQDFKPAGVKVPHLIVTFTDTLFAPDGSGPVYPDGHWKHHGKLEVDGGGVWRRVRARTDRARYWIGTV